VKQTVALLTWVILHAAVSYAAIEHPELMVPHAAQPPKLDGRSDDACWQIPPPITEFRRVDVARRLPTQRTEAWITCDEDALYIAAKCYEDRMEQVQSVETGVDGSVWKDDCLEVFLMPGQPFYYHLAANLLGTRYDARHDTQAPPQSQEPGQWDGDWAVASHRGKGYWNMEIAIPFACLELGTRRLAEPFRFNIGREQRRLTEFSCWPAAGFHKFDEFAVLKDLRLDSERYGLSLGDIVMGEGVPGPNRFAARVAEEPVANATADIRVRVRRLPHGVAQVHGGRYSSSLGGELALDYSITLTGGWVEVVVEALDNQQRTRASLCDVFRVPSAVEAALNLPLLYVSDGCVRLSGRVAISAALLPKVKLRGAVISGGKRGRELSIPVVKDSGAFSASIPIANLKPGSHLLETRLTAAGLTAEPVVNGFTFRVIVGPME